LPTAETVGPSIVDHEQVVDEPGAVDELTAHDLDDGTDGRPLVTGGNADRDPLVLLHRPQLGDREVPVVVRRNRRRDVGYGGHRRSSG
jgi:hypothetical protein